MPQLARFAWAVASLLTLLPAARGDFVLSDNTSATMQGTEVAGGMTTFSASFGTGSTIDILTSVTIPLQELQSGRAALDIYSDENLQPGTFVGELISPTGYATTATANATFTTSGIALAANSTYWAVLSSADGQFGWGWTADNTGAGVGFQGNWAESDDAGTNYFLFTTFPLQMRVAAIQTAAVPEPGSWVLLACGGSVCCWTLRNRRRRQSEPRN